MTVQEIASRLSASVIVDAKKEAKAFYVGDFLSRVMGKAPSESCWLTVMNNVNVAGVATLAEIAVVVLCEGVEPDERLCQKCKEEGISLLTTSLGAFEASAVLAK